MFAIYGSDSERMIPQITETLSNVEPFLLSGWFQLERLKYIPQDLTRVQNMSADGMSGQVKWDTHGGE